MNVPLKPSIKVANRGSVSIRITLWDREKQTVLRTFDRNAARPVFEDGQSYLLIIERGDGSEMKVMLNASTMVGTGPVIVVVQ
jgi:hypothetical protein